MKKNRFIHILAAMFALFAYADFCHFDNCGSEQCENSIMANFPANTGYLNSDFCIKQHDDLTKIKILTTAIEYPPKQ